MILALFLSISFLTALLWWWARPAPPAPKVARTPTTRPRTVAPREPVAEPDPGPETRSPADRSAQEAARDRMLELGNAAARPFTWYGHVRNAAGLPKGTVVVRGCGSGALPDETGYYELQGEPGPCELRAERKDGALVALGEPVSVSAGPGNEQEVDLEVSLHPAAGMGIGFRPTEDGMEVTMLHSGGGAAEAGLLPGDVIVEIDGESTADMSTSEFMEWGVGVAGTEVTLRVRGANGTRTVKMERKFIPDDE